MRNQQGDITKIFKVIGNTKIILIEYEYDAWGNIIQVDYNQSYLTEAQQVHSVNQYFYRGYRYDKEIDLYYLNSRFYNSNIGRFINADGLLGQQGNILGHNMYAYTQNNPVMYSDISGYAPEWLKTTGIIIAAIAIVVLVTIAVTLTAGLAAYIILGAAAQTGIATVMIGAAAGGLIAGSVSMVGEAFAADSNGSDYNFGKLAINTFWGSSFGAISGFGGAGASLGMRIGTSVGKVGLAALSSGLHGVNDGKSFTQIWSDVGKSTIISVGMQSVSMFGGSYFSGNNSNYISSGVVLVKSTINYVFD